MELRNFLLWAIILPLGVASIAPHVLADGPLGFPENGPGFVPQEPLPFPDAGSPGPTAPDPEPPPTPPATHEDMLRIATNIQNELRAMSGWIRQQHLPPLMADADAVFAECEKMVTVAAGRADVSTLRAQFELYRLVWLRLATRLRAMPQADPVVISHTDSVERSNDLLRELLVVGPAGVYDQKKAAKLTTQLSDATALLVRIVRVRSPMVPNGPDVLMAAQRLDGQARQLCQAVGQNIAFTVVVEQYQQFADAWMALNDRLRPLLPLDPQLRSLVPEICQIDAMLARQLLADPPGRSIQNRRLGLATSIARSGDALVAALLDQLLGSAGPVQAAEEFALSAESLCLWIKAHPMSQIDVTRPEVAAVSGALRRLENQMNRLERARFPLAFQIVEQTRGEWELLFKILQE